MFEALPALQSQSLQKKRFAAVHPPALRSFERVRLARYGHAATLIQGPALATNHG